VALDLDVIVGRDPALLPFAYWYGVDGRALTRRSISANSSFRLTPSLR
jgi:hypothetical protein